MANTIVPPPAPPTPPMLAARCLQICAEETQHEASKIDRARAFLISYGIYRTYFSASHEHPDCMEAIRVFRSRVVRLVADAVRSTDFYPDWLQRLAALRSIGTSATDPIHKMEIRVAVASLYHDLIDACALYHMVRWFSGSHPPGWRAKLNAMEAAFEENLQLFESMERQAHEQQNGTRQELGDSGFDERLTRITYPRHSLDERYYAHKYARDHE